MTLSTRVEQAGEDDTRRLLEEAGGILLFAPVHDNGALESLPGKRIRFYRMLYAEAFLDAAMMLVPDGWRKSISDIVSPGCHACVMDMGAVNPGTLSEGYARAATPALTLCAAALKARGL